MFKKKEITVDGNTIKYHSYNDFKRGRIKDPLTNEVYAATEYICSLLNVKCPYLKVIDMPMISHNTATGQDSMMGAITYKTTDCKDLDNNLIVISIANLNNELFNGILAHEIRHIWQAKYKPELIQKDAADFGESLMHPAEIDADGFAIWFMSTMPNMNLKKAASLLCPEEKRRYPKAFFYREEAAKKIAKNYE